MKTFFFLTVLGGFLKFLYAMKNDEVETIDIIALIYSVLILLVAIVYYLATGEDPLSDF